MNEFEELKCVCGEEKATFAVTTFVGSKPTIIPLSLGCAEQIYYQLTTLLRASMVGAMLKEPIGMKAKIIKEGKTGGAGEVGVVLAKVKTNEGICAYIVTPQNPKGYLKLLTNVEEVSE